MRSTPSLAVPRQASLVGAAGTGLLLLPQSPTRLVAFGGGDGD